MGVVRAFSTGQETMTQNWKDKGERWDLLDHLTLGGSARLLGVDHDVEIDGEHHVVYVEPGQEVGDAIKKGQFKED